MFPHASVAVHVLIIVVGHKPPGAASKNPTVTTPVQLSVAVAVPVVPGKVPAVQSIVMSAGHVMEGAVSSKTVIVCIQVDELPQASVAL